ncbi:hypothetical protein [Brevundimonas sp.]|uniref:hypothetical protein n=1 Tax=Brevundimonas sp. TaxID=1871086 RepID=UPI002FC775DC
MGIRDRIRLALGISSRAAPAVIPEAPREGLAMPDDLPRQIVRVQEASLDIYHQHGIPTEDGSYCAKGPDAPWEKLPDGLTPAEKWNLLQAAPEGAGWRFGTRASLGRHSLNEDVRQASSLLQTCDALRQKLESDEAITASDIADALLLGTASGLLLKTRNTKADGETYAPLVFTSVVVKN